MSRDIHSRKFAMDLRSQPHQKKGKVEGKGSKKTKKHSRVLFLTPDASPRCNPPRTSSSCYNTSFAILSRSTKKRKHKKKCEKETSKRTKQRGSRTKTTATTKKNESVEGAADRGEEEAGGGEETQRVRRRCIIDDHSHNK